MAKITDSKAAPKRRPKQATIVDEFYRQGLGPGYPEEEFGPSDNAAELNNGLSSRHG